MTAPRSSLTLALAGLALALLLVLFLHRTPPPAPTDLSAVAESDRWRYTPEGRAKYLATLQAREARAAKSFGWVDEPKGIVRLPIDVAMDLKLKEIAASRR